MKTITENSINLTEENKSEFTKLLLKLRGINSRKDIDDFISPDLNLLTTKLVNLNDKQIKKAIERIKSAINKNEKIAIFGDYDVDGITGAAILFETIYLKYKNVTAYIPHRVDEGYGLSINGIDNLLKINPDCKLIITVDNGIVAYEAVEYANSLGIDVIITDHHLEESSNSKNLDSLAIIHTTKLCGSGVAYLFAQILVEDLSIKDYQNESHLELACLGTIADMVELTSANRIIAYHGIKLLRNTKRLGLLSIIKYSGIEKESIDTYEIGNIIAPRLNATGRMYSAMDSLRLICTKDEKRALELAHKLEQANRLRQDEMKSGSEHAIKSAETLITDKQKIIIVFDEKYKQGVIGLIASRLVEKFYLPSIVISVGDRFSKGSVRSIKGFNIIEFLRLHSEFFVNVGGHPMAAGFTVLTEKIESLKKTLESKVSEHIKSDLLQKSIKIDFILDIKLIDMSLYKDIMTFSPFGVGNSQPVFLSDVFVEDIRFIGQNRNHIKLIVSSIDNRKVKIDAVGFNMADQIGNIKNGDRIKIVYRIDLNEWNGIEKLQLKINYLDLWLP